MKTKTQTAPGTNGRKQEKCSPHEALKTCPQLFELASVLSD